jgi:periplasmic protein TonB
MSTLALLQRAPAQWNWPRVGALSGSLSLHAAAIVLLFVPPLAMQLLRPAAIEVIPDVRLIEPPPRIEVPPLPQPPRIVHVATPKPKPTPTPLRMPDAATPPLESRLPELLAGPPSPPADIAPAAPADIAPTALAYDRRTRVPYPRDAARQRQQGTVILRVLVGIDGVPRNVEIERSSGFRSLDDAARAAVRRWTFQPGTRGGIATPLWARVPISFRLDML